jgi:hypothetical protein
VTSREGSIEISVLGPRAKNIENELLIAIGQVDMQKSNAAIETDMKIKQI